VDSDWANFYVTTGGAAAALTGLLFVAVALRPREIRDSPMMVGRARAAFYAFVTVLLVALLALAGTSSRLIGLAQIGVTVGVLALSSPFTIRAWRSGSINVRRAVVYHAGLAVIGVAGALRAVQGVTKHYDVILATGILLLLAIALSNSWQLVLTHEGR
jgi:modulator of FtsH protease